MGWFLVNIRFKFDDNHVIDIKGWYEGGDYIDAVEHARLDRQWDLRPYVREGEFIHPEKVLEAKFTAKRYTVRPIVSFDVAADRSKLINKVFETDQR